VVKTGKTLAWMECRMTRASDGEVVATGKHTKFLPVGTTSKL
jgi:acyl-coenzyme A thioesterase 13